MRYWVISNGSTGMESQALGLAEALQKKFPGEIDLKKISLKTPWKQLAPYLRWGLHLCLAPNSDKLEPPWPDIAIGTGRAAILPLLYVKKKSAPTKIIYTQNPYISTSNFDLIVAPKHDHLKGDNIIETLGSLHRVTPERLEEYKALCPELVSYPSPKLAVLIGGSNRSYQLTSESILTLVTQLKKLQEKHGYTLLVTTSRRTGENHILQLKHLLPKKNTFLNAHPYFTILAWADAIAVSCDSINMISEAYSTNKPVYLISLPGYHPKFDSFHRELENLGRLHRFSDLL